MVDATLWRLSQSPVTALLGARQVGKTTLAKQVVSAWDGPASFHDLEVPAVREAFRATPERILRRGEGLVVIDEVQRVPELFEVLRPICDDPGRKAVFLLLGSASWDLVRGVSETLAGRISFLDLSGFSLDEVGERDQDRLWIRGGFPRAYLADSEPARALWMESFARTFLERDIPALRPRVSPEALGRFWTMLAHVHSQTWNGAALARSMGVGVGTVNRYRDLLAGTFIVRLLQPWFENVGKRVVKAPKMYLRDSGVLHHLLNVASMDDLVRHPAYGPSWEGFALEQTLVAFGGRQAHFWRTQRGAELDLLLHRGGRRWGFEFKCADAPTTTKSMHVVIRDLELEHLWVVYPGELEYDLADRITATPLRNIRQLKVANRDGRAGRRGMIPRRRTRT